MLNTKRVHHVSRSLLALLWLGLMSVEVALGAQPRLLSWEDMVPEGTKLHVPPVVSHNTVGILAASQINPEAPVVPALEGQRIRLPGYVVPLETNVRGAVTEFLLVPYFGACIHVPPPPSNQIVHVRYPAGVMQETLYQPYWIQGTLAVQSYSTELAQAGYSMTAETVLPYGLD